MLADFTTMRSGTVSGSDGTVTAGVVLFIHGQLARSSSKILGRRTGLAGEWVDGRILSASAMRSLLVRQSAIGQGAAIMSREILNVSNDIAGLLINFDDL